MEEITGESWESLVQSRIRKPLGLDSLHLLEPGWETICPPPLALKGGRLVQIPPFYSQKHHLIAPASELRMSVTDLARWGQHHLSLPADTDRWRVHCPVSVERDLPDHGPLSYGLGWRIDTVRGHKRVWHSGHCSGYTSLLSLYPNEGIGLAAAVNQSDAVQELHQLERERIHGNQML
jgi:CubicO group peptidase (beta-lactamase class C family)